MRIVSTGWIEGSLAIFEAKSCLYTHAVLGHASAATPFEIFILNGFDKITDAFAAPLRERHIILHDATAVTRVVAAHFSQLQGCIGNAQNVTYEVNCFLRWIVILELLGREPFIHIDLDLFFQQPLTEVTQVFAGLTGTFGSPCLTAVGNVSWLETYRDALGELASNRAGLQVRLGYNGNEFRKDISSDQDLVLAMESANLLPKHGLASLHSQYSVFVNPLWPYQHKPAEPLTMERKHGRDLLGGKPVLFWHLQNNAADYLSRFALLMSHEDKWLGGFLPVKLSLPFIQLAPSAENFAFEALRIIAWQRIEEAILHGRPIVDMNGAEYFARSWVSNWFIVQGQGRGLFTKAYWWEDGVCA